MSPFIKTNFSSETYKFIKMDQSSKQRTNHWATGLLQAMKDPSLQVISNDIAVVIKDKYPKAKYHYLILPWENIPDIYHVISHKLSFAHNFCSNFIL